MQGSSEIEIDDEDLEFELPLEAGKPLVEEYLISTENTNAGLNLYWAPKPFNQRSGHT